MDSALRERSWQPWVAVSIGVFFTVGSLVPLRGEPGNATVSLSFSTGTRYSQIAAQVQVECLPAKSLPGFPAAIHPGGAFCGLGGKHGGLFAVQGQCMLWVKNGPYLAGAAC